MPVDQGEAMMARPGRSESGRRWLRAASVCLALSLLLSSAPLIADSWYEEYDRGLKQLRKGDAATAAVAFQAALADRSTPGRRVRAYGMRYLDYFPHLMLGRSYIEMQRFDMAVPELEAALAAGAAPAGEVRPLLEQARQEVARRALPAAVAAADPPPAPSGLLAVSEGVGGRVRLNWNGADGAEYYEVQSSTTGEDWTDERSVRATEPTVLLSGLPRGEIRGRVRSVSTKDGAGPWSPVVTANLAVGEAEARAAGEKFEAGRASMENGRYAEAAAALTEAAAVMENHAHCLAMIGTCHATLHFLKNDPVSKTEAQRWFRRVLDADPSFRLDERRVSPKIVRMLDSLR